MKRPIAQTFLLSLGLLIASMMLMVNVAIANPLLSRPVLIAQVNAQNNAQNNAQDNVQGNGVSPNASEQQPVDPSSPTTSANGQAQGNPDNDGNSTNQTATATSQNNQNKPPTQSNGLKSIEAFYKSLYGS